MTIHEAIDAAHAGRSSTVCCPAHEDRSPSLSVFTGVNQPILLHCHAGCTVPEILAASGLTMSDIGNPSSSSFRRATALERSAPTTPPPLTQEALDAIAREFPSDLRSLFHEAPNPCVDVPEPELWRVFLTTIYKPTDIVWMGGKFDSGEPRHARNFRPVGEWVAGDPAGALSSLSTFKQGSTSRGLSSVDQPKHFVVESDTVPISQQGTAIRFCRQFAELVAIIHSGNKSLHAWFRRPTEPVVMAELERIMPQLGADPAGLRNPAQPFRMPGFKREDSERYTGLLWLAGGLE
jgi:hypothetical protein